jgi:hypothetical protein
MTNDEAAVLDKLHEHGSPLSKMGLARRLGWLKPVEDRIQKALDGLRDQRAINTAYYPFDDDEFE